MNPLCEHAKQELFNALNGKQSGVFVVDGKLVSIEIENNDVNSQNDSAEEDLSLEIEEYTELKESLSRYLNNPSMKRYSATELKDKRHAKRKK
ncbi:hypothetical protein [Ureibacillus acetophenoni]|uniref:Uncharacterized protein n=1 Tax=Ureibacillus acetophenoni TaxID=614649 RepID=A0A285U9I6_9BACL|nr:hypothetical protein [Ureibacillus acetophenoni]SOC38570.1 hypothetical protein SAMN05877842_104178 [Ureibacillus acetophenoni]